MGNLERTLNQLKKLPGISRNIEASKAMEAMRLAILEIKRLNNKIKRLEEKCK